MDSKIKHLEIIQSVINRLANNSFLLRGWSVTLASAILVFSDRQMGKLALTIVFLPLVVFWFLDGYFLSRERRYRTLYDHVRKLTAKNIDFTLDSRPFNCGKNTWLAASFSIVLVVFYGTLFGTVLLVIWFLK